MVTARTAPVSGDTAVNIATKLDAAVFPLRPDKTPYLAGSWRESSTPDGAGIKRLWAMAGGSAYVGVDCGKSSLVVVDVDDVSALPSALLKALDEHPTLVLKSLNRGGDHYYFRGLAGGRPIPGGDIKGIGGYVLASVDGSLEDREIAELPLAIKSMFDLKMPAVGADGKPSGTGEVIDASLGVDVEAWLSSREGWLHGSPDAGQKFIDVVLAKFTERVDAGEHRRMSAMNAAWAMAKEVEAGFYPGWDAHQQLADAYRELRDADPVLSKRWNAQREADYESMWAGAVAKIQGGQYDDEIAEMRRAKSGDEDLGPEMSEWLAGVAAGTAGTATETVAGDLKTAGPEVEAPESPGHGPESAGSPPAAPVLETWTEDGIELPLKLRLYRSGDMHGDVPDLDEAVYAGLVGEALKCYVDATEASVASVGGSLLAMLGAWLGRGVLCRVSPSVSFPAVIYTAIVGPTAGGRKGTAKEAAWKFMDMLDPEFATDNIRGGYASGEALIHDIADAEMVLDKTGVWKSKGGTEDQRLCVIEGEFSRILVAMGRKSSTMSHVLRDAYDHERPIATKAVGSGKKVSSGHHVTVTGGITVPELLDGFGQLSATNGLGNRFTWIWTGPRSYMPAGDTIPMSELAGIASRMRGVARTGVYEMRRAEDVAMLWDSGGLYRELEDYGEPTVSGAIHPMVSRASTLVMRCATIYAACDGADVIEMPHLRAGLAWEQYSRATVGAVFSGLVTETALAGKVVGALQRAPGIPVSRAELFKALGWHTTAAELDSAISSLVSAGLVWEWTREPEGRGQPARFVVATMPRKGH